MKLKFTIIFIVFLAVGVGYARPEEAQKPLTKDQVMGLVEGGDGNFRSGRAHARAMASTLL